ncbi:MAG TPA: hypothetical protein VKU00_14635 [Chthonomonadaceae bacterium]|nr:hypothetical protein [Chthonomonadaceae bacterium]
MSDSGTHLSLTQLPLVVSITGFAVQTLVQVVIDPCITYVIRGFTGIPPTRLVLRFNETEVRSIVLKLCSWIAGLLIAGLSPIKILDSLLFTAGYQGGPVAPWIDVLFSGLVIGAGTEGANSLLKFIQYAKDARAAIAAQSKPNVASDTPTGELSSPTLGSQDLNFPPGTKLFRNNFDNLVLATPVLQPIFWGSYWKTPTTVTQQNIEDALKSLVQSDYLVRLEQYGYSGTVDLLTSIVTDEDLGRRFDRERVEEVIQKLLDTDSNITQPDTNQNAYLVIVPPDVVFNPASANGAHSIFLDDQNRTVHYAWVTYSLGAQIAVTVANFTAVCSHELVEMITDPELNAWQTSHTNCSQTGPCEIADVCRREATWNGLRFHSYWSNQDGSSVIPVVDMLNS